MAAHFPDVPELPPPVVPDEPELLPPPMLDESEVPEVPEEAAGAEEGLDFAAFLCFLDFLCGWVAPVSVLAPALEAPGCSVPELAPEVSLGIRPLAPLGWVLLLPDAAPVPDAPDVSRLDDGALGVLAEEPDGPDMPEAPGDPDVPEAPLLPAMPASLLFWLLGLDMLLSVLELLPAEVCASTTEDTDATKTSDRDRIAFNVMSSSLS